MAPIELQVSGGRLRGKRRDSPYSDPPPLIALHPGVADSRSWSAMFDLLEGIPALVAYDRRGYGVSPPPTRDTTRSTISHASWTRSRPSASGSWATRSGVGFADLAVTQPERVAGLILLSPGVSGSPEMDFDETTALLFDAAVRAFEAGDLAEAAAIEAKIWLDGPAAAEGRVAGAACALALEMSTAALASDSEREQFERDPGIAAWDRLQRLTMPVIVACGLLDVPAVIDEGRAIADRVPGARFAELEGVAHLPSLEGPSGSPSSCGARCWRRQRRASASRGRDRGCPLSADADDPDNPDPDERTGRPSSAVRTVLRAHPGSKAVDDQPKQPRADDRADEGADDPRPETVGEPDREVPDRQTHDHPSEQTHQRLPWRRLRERPRAGGLGLGLGRGSPAPG